jgi:hypothetical protein
MRSHAAVDRVAPPQPIRVESTIAGNGNTAHGFGEVVIGVAMFAHAPSSIV